MAFDNEVIGSLKSYVYLYIDPRDGRPFYIGKGVGNRLFAHLDDTAESAKVAKIAEIRAAGLSPDIEILRYGLTDAEAALVEASCIELVGLDNLTNKVRGIHSQSFGRISLPDLRTMLSAKPVTVDVKAVLITINRLYSSKMSPLELYEATRGIWKLGERCRGAEYAMAIYQGIVREVYRIEAWHDAGTLEYQTRDATEFLGSGRKEFSGVVASDIRERFVGGFVGKGGQNPIRYANV
jgi:hypothetical protein